jgi:hypothetical protein
MGYVEIRIQRDIQQLRREVKATKARGEQTRLGCLDLVSALKELATSLDGTDDLAAARVTSLVDQASALFDPPAEEE